MLLAAWYLVLTWLLGSIPSGLVIGTLFTDTDVTRSGSGNIGATNVTRVIGRRYGAITLVADVLKGAVPVLLAAAVTDAAWYPGLVALAAFAGHCWSAFLEFRGGKGVATAAGAMLVLAPWATLVSVVAWVVVVMATRRSSIGGLVGAGLLPLLTLWFHGTVWWVALLLSAGVVWRHRDNIRRLMAGDELKLGQDL